MSNQTTEIRYLSKSIAKNVIYEEDGCTVYCEELAKRLYLDGYRNVRDVVNEILNELSKATGEWGCYCLSTGKFGYLTSDVHRTINDIREKFL